MKNFNISEYAYKELLYFCMQYGEKKKQVENGYGVRAVRFNITQSKSTTLYDTTFENANNIIRLKNDIDMIERAAKETDDQLYDYIIKNVSYSVPFDLLRVPCGRRQFYNKRKYFFYRLYCLKNEK